MTGPISINQERDQGTQHLPDVNATSREVGKKKKTSGKRSEGRVQQGPAVN